MSSFSDLNELIQESNRNLRKKKEPEPEKLRVIKSKQSESLNVSRLAKRNIIKTVEKQESELPELSIDYTYLTFYSNEQMISESVVDITKEDYGPESLYDLKLGITDYDKYCETDNKDYNHCPGHYGVIKLVEPIYYPTHIDIIIKILRSICNSCGGLLISKDSIDIELSGKNRLLAISKASEKKPCNVEYKLETVPGVEMGDIKKCSNNPIYIPSKLKKGKIEYKILGSNKLYERTVEQTAKIFSAINDEDIIFLGFNHGSRPENLIVKSILVLPPVARAPSERDGKRYEDEIVARYRAIIKANKELAITTKESIKHEKRNTIITNYSLIISKTDEAGAHLGTYKSIGERIQGKKGIVRKSLMGKRVDYSARSVVGPGINLKFGQIGIPRKMESFLTVPVVITAENKQYMINLLKLGKISRIKKDVGENKGMSYNVYKDKKYKIFEGDIVNRYLMEGDYIIYNRQPTLHRQGMMGAEVVFHDDLNIKLHLSYTSPFNADFDGDEMNLHMPQTQNALKEVRHLMNVVNFVMDPQTNRPSMGLTFDSLTGAYLMSTDESEISKSLWERSLNLITSKDQLKTLDKRLYNNGVKKFTGKALFSALLPEDFYYQYKDVSIKNGILISGNLERKNVGIHSKSMIVNLWKEYGIERTAMFLTDAPWIINEYVTSYGFSVGLDDIFPDVEGIREAISKEINLARLFTSTEFIERDTIELQQRENEIVQRLNFIRDKVSKEVIDSVDKNNALNIMISSGAKGSNLNIAQITALLGQQFLFGERMKQTLTDGTRCLPYFRRNDTDPEARGFCVNSFASGLSPSELFFHQAGGREGVIDTAIKTADTGALHRRVGKIIEDVKVTHEGSVVKANGDIIQFTYGGDGFSADMLQSTGDLYSFINLDSIIGKINSSYGF
uniref:DNA-directed RNA polymerase subunit n=1 Tax=Pithovirus LCPAC104 TaxID=2506589 RepID=A0A481Z5D1_9VIRU|nr:MAG: DNA-directed RNA polymerase subunit alpha [Pithovirus LCPAC104]